MVRSAGPGGQRGRRRMDRHQQRDAQRHGWEPSSRAVAWIGGLALWLALLSFTQSAVWRSEVAVWQQAQAVAPTLPDPWIHGAQAVLDAPGDLRDPARWSVAEGWLDRAESTVPAQGPTERAWARDAIDATRAVIRMRQGRLVDAAILMASGPPASARGVLCAHFRGICALVSLPVWGEYL